ncbi:MAG: ADP-forming succinate--CoA ligase subunit beta, partial [Thermoplasmata archaeon]|nr:ADP-forming succinate--CoA ligase subunit beta [Thermoplasmata archaeon]
IKAQVLAGGRGKGGAVRFASSPEEAGAAARAILGMTFQGEPVRELLLEQKLALEGESYLSLSLDRAARKPILIASAHGGVEIESVEPGAIHRTHIDPLIGLVGYEKRNFNRALGFSGERARAFDGVVDKLWTLFEEEDAELVEINPLASVGNSLIALDAKVIVEDDAVFRHPGWAELPAEVTALEAVARAKGIAFVQLDGDIGVIANGAGLTMATLDVLGEFGGHPGVFLDLGGTDDPAKVAEAFLLMARAKPRAVFLNIFGGVTRCDTVARGLIDAMGQIPAAERFPLVARIRGNNEAEGVALLRGAGIVSLSDLKGAVQAAVRAAGEGLTAAPGAPS